jgi:hypothetical protein
MVQVPIIVSENFDAPTLTMMPSSKYLCVPKDRESASYRIETMQQNGVNGVDAVIN